MTEEGQHHGFLVVRRSAPGGLPFTPGQVVDVYPLAAPLDLSDLSSQPLLIEPPPNPHELAHRLGDELHRARRRLDVVHRLSCDCKGLTDPPTLATAVIAEKQLWALIGREKVPAAFRAGRLPGPSAWPLHSEPNGAPHVEVTSCGACRRTWAIALTATSITRVDLARPLYSRSVVE